MVLAVGGAHVARATSSTAAGACTASSWVEVYAAPETPELMGVYAITGASECGGTQYTQLGGGHYIVPSSQGWLWKTQSSPCTEWGGYVIAGSATHPGEIDSFHYAEGLPAEAYVRCVPPNNGIRVRSRPHHAAGHDAYALFSR